MPPYRYERVQGRLVVLEPASADHRDTARPFRLVLSGYWEEDQDIVDYVDIRGGVATSTDDDPLRLPPLDFRRTALIKVAKGITSTEEILRTVPVNFGGEE